MRRGPEAGRRGRKDQNTDGDKREYMQGAEVGDDADGTGKQRQRTGITMKDGAADIVKAKVEGVEPEQQKGGLDVEAAGKKFYKQRIDFIFDHGHHGWKSPYSGRTKIEGFTCICFSQLTQVVESDTANGNLLYQCKLRFGGGQNLVKARAVTTHQRAKCRFPVIISRLH